MEYNGINNIILAIRYENSFYKVKKKKTSLIYFAKILVKIPKISFFIKK